jgi:hypothetical protein
MTASKESVRARFMALLTAQADLAEFKGSPSTSSGPYKEGYREWISYPASRAEIEETIRVLIRSLATSHGLSASYPPLG